MFLQILISPYINSVDSTLKLTTKLNQLILLTNPKGKKNGSKGKKNDKKERAASLYSRLPDFIIQ